VLVDVVPAHVQDGHAAGQRRRVRHQLDQLGEQLGALTVRVRGDEADVVAASRGPVLGPPVGEVRRLDERHRLDPVGHRPQTDDGPPVVDREVLGDPDVVTGVVELRTRHQVTLQGDRAQRLERGQVRRPRAVAIGVVHRTPRMDRHTVHKALPAPSPAVPG